MKRLPWWQNFQVVAWVVGGLTALGTVAVVTAKYIELPTKVEAAEQKNELQDDAILELKKSNEVWQQIYTQQQQQQQQQVPNQAYPPQHPTDEILNYEWKQDAYGNWYCQGAETWWWPDRQTGRCR